MSHEHDPVNDLDLNAYIDDQLEPGRRIEVAAWLAERPEKAARVMSDLRSRDELRLALALPGASGRSTTSDAARRLERGLLRLRVGLDVLYGDGVAVIGGEDEQFLELALALAVHGVVELHLGDGFVTACGHPAVTPRVDADVNVRLLHHAE